MVEESKPQSKSKDVKDKIFYWTYGLILVIFCFVLIYPVTPRGNVTTSHIEEKKRARDQILRSTYYDAEIFANTVNLADYKTISESKSKLKRDSSYYAHKISHFIHVNGQMHYKETIIGNKKYSALLIDEELLRQDPEFQKYLNGYKRSAEQLVLRRRLSKQK